MQPLLDASEGHFNDRASDCLSAEKIVESSPVSSPFSKLRHAAEAAGTRCLASNWDGWQTSYPFECQEGHRFARSASFVVYHQMSCPECRDLERLQELKRVAESRGGLCLETAWQGSGVRHRFQCASGHVWQASPRKVTGEGSWCRRCAQQEHSTRMLCQDGLARLQEAARHRGGELLDTVYAGMHLHYRFSCAKGHHWQAEGGEIVRGSWCRECAIEDKRLQYRLPDGLARLQTAAQARQGICLSPEYIDSRSHYRFRCQKGHEWHTTGQRIFRGAWCPSCAHDGKRMCIDQMRELAQQRGGQCLSEHYTNSSSKLQWQCHRGHQWHALPGSVMRGHWCAVCACLHRISNPRSKTRSKYVSAK